MTTVPASVVIPTIGRAETLERTLESLAACAPAADEVLVVDQSHSPEVAELVARFAEVGARLVLCEGSGVGRGRNLGLREAAHETVLITDDDCTVAPDWIGTAEKLVARHPGAILTGRVLPAGDPLTVPSTIEDPLPRDYTGGMHCWVLYPNNMVCRRSMVLELGGFDDRVRNAEDNDFCYRWLRAGNALRYEPELVVWHHDWRTREELGQLYMKYARGQGYFYAKHLRKGDLRVIRFIAEQVYGSLRSLAAATIRGRARWSDPRRAVLRGVPAGIVEGWSRFGEEESGGDGAAAPEPAPGPRP